MLSDPEIDKMIIYGLLGVCCVLLLAVIYLAVKKNVYYVDEEGAEVPPPGTSLKRIRIRKKAAAEPEPQEVSQEEPELIVPEAVETPAEEQPESEPEIQPAEEADDVTKVVTLPIREEFAEPEPVEEEPEPEVHLFEAVEEPEPVRIMEPVEEEEEIQEEEIPEPLPIPSAVNVTVTVAGQSASHAIDTLPCLIGRDQTSCNLVIAEPAVSRRHARIYANEDGLFIEDVSEHNGTFHNGIKLPSLGSAALREGDRISLGRAEIIIDSITY